MADLEIAEYREYDAFAQDWSADGGSQEETEARLRWQLLGQLDDDELLIQLPEWLANEKVGFVDGATPTEFVGRIDQETKQTIRFIESAAAQSLSKRAHRIQKLEESVESGAEDADREEWLTDRLEEHRQAFEQREDAPGLAEEWLPKNQVQRAVRRID